MGQILDRIFRYAKSEVNSVSPSKADDYIKKTSEEEELKRIIDELNEKKKEDKKQKEQSGSGSDQQMNLDRACEILNIKSDATIDDIKASYKKKMKEYHPDRVSGLGKELQELAKKKSIDINEAYDFIRKVRNF
jgi:DnaJ-domain-containing protein 1